MPVNQSDLDFFREAQTIMSSLLSKASNPLTLKEIRATVKYFRPFLSKEPLLPFDKLLINTSSGYNLKARYIAKGEKKKPLLLFFPGTAFIHEMFDENYTVLSRMIKQMDCHGLMLEYRLSPEAPFPCAHKDAATTLDYVLEHADELNVDKRKIILSGFSSGANMAAVLANNLTSQTDFKPFHQYLLSGAYDYTDSLHEFDNYVNEDKMLDKGAQTMSFDLYCQDADRRDSYCSPYWQDDFSNLCSTTIQCGEYDGGRSQSEGYARKLAAHNVNIDKVIMPGQSHLTIIYRGACSDGEDPAFIAAEKINRLLREAQ